MEANDLAAFNQAMAMAQAGQKAEAYARFKELVKLNHNYHEPNLLLWIAFTSPDLSESEAAINMAADLEPNNPGVRTARNWLMQEKQRQAASFQFNPAYARPDFTASPQPSAYAPAPAVATLDRPGKRSDPYGGTLYLPPAMPGWKVFLTFVSYFFLFSILVGIFGAVTGEFVTEGVRNDIRNGVITTRAQAQRSLEAGQANVRIFYLFVTAGVAFFPTFETVRRRRYYGKKATSHPALVFVLVMLFLPLTLALYIADSRRFQSRVNAGWYAFANQKG